MQCNFKALVLDVLHEENVSGGVGSVYGAGVEATSASITGGKDTWATGDMRVPVVLNKKVQRRRFPENLLFGKKRNKKNKK